MLSRVERVRMYSIQFEDDRVKKLISWYIEALQRAIDIVWDNIRWIYDFRGFRIRKNVKFKIPKIPSNSTFQEDA